MTISSEQSHVEIPVQASSTVLNSLNGYTY